MPRPQRLNIPRTLCHITNRGTAKQYIHLDEDDFAAFVDKLALTIDRYRWSLHAYALMTNHFHLLMETFEANLSRGMQYLGSGHARRFNRKHDRVGHLFQGRFKSTPIESESHLFEVMRYVVLNPVRAGLVSDPADWTWSSYSATAGFCTPPRWLNVTWTLQQFDPQDVERARLLYRTFVAAGIRPLPTQADVADATLPGRDRSPREIVENITQSRPRKPTLDEIGAGFEQVLRVSRRQLERGHGGDARTLFAHLARTEAAATLNEIGAILGLSDSRVSRLLVSAAERIGAGELREKADGVLAAIRPATTPRLK